MTATRYGRSFLPALVVGSAVMAYGVYGLFENSGRTHPDQWVRWFIGAALVHDLLLAPVIIGLGVLTMRAVPGRWYASVQAALVATALVCASVAPFLLGFGRRADNPTLLPNDYWRGLAYALSGVWAGTLGAHRWLGRETRRRAREGSEDAMQGKSDLERYLRDNKVAHEFHHHPEAFTAQEVAAADHVPGRTLAKVVILVAGDTNAMAVVPAPEQIDLTKAAEAIGVSEARIAAEDEFASLFPGCDTGAMPPFGNGTIYDLPVYVDEALPKEKSIVFDACTHTDTVHMAYQDFDRLVHPSVVRLT